ncbi:hypothetical protein SK128_000077 [Halocaridina rubra]|uniref:Uncharacterized protein n=1 Tax=Halocaridina rubra TaxID=373956 RepID=A0AAN8WP19_HALRR
MIYAAIQFLTLMMLVVASTATVALGPSPVHPVYPIFDMFVSSLRIILKKLVKSEPVPKNFQNHNPSVKTIYANYT